MAVVPRDLRTSLQKSEAWLSRASGKAPTPWGLGHAGRLRDRGAIVAVFGQASAWSHEPQMTRSTMKDVQQRIPGLARLHILVAGLLLACSCDGSGMRTLPTHDAGSTSGSGGAVATGGGGPNAGSGGSGGAPSTQGSTNSRTLGANQCRGNADCDVRQGATCVPLGGAPPCGLCLRVTSPCTSDSDCQGDGAPSICDVAVGCVCPTGSKTCIPGCSGSLDCGTGEACTDHHCVPAACRNDADCPTDFGCNSGTCGRKTCATDADCNGYCVTGACYSTPGTCYGAVI